MIDIVVDNYMEMVSSLNNALLVGKYVTNYKGNYKKDKKRIKKMLKDTEEGKFYKYLEGYQEEDEYEYGEL